MDYILDPIVRSNAGEIGYISILHADNARPHIARLMQQYLEVETFIQMEWPAHSLNISPIKNMWDDFGRCLSDLQLFY